MAEEPSALPTRRFHEKMVLAAADVVKQGTLVASTAAIAGGIAAYIPSKMTNEFVRYRVGFNETENQDIRDRLRRLREKKEELGISKKGVPQWELEKRAKHFWERWKGEFGGDLSKWAQESEPALAAKVFKIENLETIDWYSFWPMFFVLFPIFTTMAYTRLDRYITKLRGMLLEQTVNLHGEQITHLSEENKALKARIDALELQSKELKGLMLFVDVLTTEHDKTGELSQEQIRKFQAIVARGTKIMASLPPEVIPQPDEE
ncbi:hypothetical protein HY968_00460 [Candidatus Kaiserbacteria bacterium]|nr:hypothetical protein [Candidatus Kaiserbacteria bacterium]